MRRQGDFSAFLVPALALLFVAAVIHISLHIDPEPPQYARQSLPVGNYHFQLPQPTIELVLPKSPLLDYPADGFDWSNHPLSPKRNVTRYVLAPVPEAHKPLVSVVTLINSAGAVQYLNESLASLMQQTLQDFEWIILLSTRDLVPLVAPTIDRVLPSFGPLHAPIYTIVAPKPALMMHFWLALGNATNSSLVFHLAVDSMLEPTALEKAYWHLRSHDAPHVKAVSGRAVYFSPERRVLPAIGFQLGELMLEKYILPTEMLWRKEAWVGMQVSTEVTESNQFWFNWLRVMPDGAWGSTVAEYLAWERTEWQLWKSTSVEVTEAARRILRGRFKSLFSTGFQPPAIPDSPPHWHRANVLAKARTEARLLLLVDSFAPSLANPTLSLVAFVQRAGYNVTLVVLHGRPPPQLYTASDAFFLESFLSRGNLAPFLYYLAHSRAFDALLFIGAVPAFLVSVVRHALPRAHALRYSPLGSAAGSVPPADVPTVRELADSSLEPPLMSLSDWGESASARLFQRQNFLLRTDAPLLLLPSGASLTAANETAQILARLEADARLRGTVVVLRDRLASLEPWSAVHPLFRWAVRNSTTASVRVLVVSAYEPDVYRAWLRAADGLLLFDASFADVTIAWHHAALNGAWLALGPSVRHAALPESILRTASVDDLYERLAGLLQSGGEAEKKAVRQGAAPYTPRPLDELLTRLSAAPPAPASAFASEAEMQAWAEAQAREAGWV